MDFTDATKACPRLEEGLGCENYDFMWQWLACA